MDLSSVLLGVGVILLLGLLAYAVYLGLKLRQQRLDREISDKQLAQESGNRDAEARQSLQIIARALVQKDLSETEAAMRIAWYSQQITLSEDEAQQVSVFQQLAVATSHIPILDDWAALSKSEKRSFNIERESIEGKFREFIQANALLLTRIHLRQ